MNPKHIIRIVGSLFSATAAIKAFSKAKNDNDTLKMIDAGLSAASVAVTVAIVVREIRHGDEHNRVVELEDGA